MCGVVGIIANRDVGAELYDALIHLQHRGQDSCGMATFNRRFHLKKGIGLVRDVFDENNMARMKGNIGLGHTRYVTIGGTTAEDAQPFVLFSPYGFALAHNGNIFNYEEIREELMVKNLRFVNSDCDSELIMHILGNEIRKVVKEKINFPQKLFKAVAGTSRRLKGSYSVVAIFANQGLLAFRDPWGLRPLTIGRRKIGRQQPEYIFSSENIMFNALGFKDFGDVGPGEAVFVDLNGKIYRKKYDSRGHHICIFEYIYFARPDAFLDGISVYRARLRLGHALAQKIKKLRPKLKVDVVVPAPSTANTAACSLAYELGVKYREGLVKNHFIGRTFIMPGQKIRQKSVQLKLNPQRLELAGKNVLLVDDSIVRGNTSKEIIEIVRRAGAKKVYLAITCPPLRWPCLYGIDMPVRKDFIADKLTIEEIRTKIGADELFYQDLDDLVWATIRKGKHPVKKPCVACFNGQYPTKDIDEKILKKVEADRLAAYKQFGYLEEEVKESRVMF